jgi:hypothetical protein
MVNEGEITGANSSGAVFKRHLGMLVLGIVCLFGTFSPWVTVAGIFSVTGNKSEWGITTLLTSLAFVIYALSGLLENPHLIQQRELFRKISIAVSAITLVALLFLLYKYIDAVSEYNKSMADSKASLDNSGLGEWGNAFNGMLESLAESVKPQVGIGYIACLVSVTLGLLLSFFKSPKNVQPFEAKNFSRNNSEIDEDVPSSSARKVKKEFKITFSLPSANRKIVIVLIGSVILAAIAYMSFQFGKESKNTSQTIEKKSVDTSSPVREDFELDVIETPEVAKSLSPKTKSSVSPKATQDTNSKSAQEIGTPEFITILGVPKKLHLDFFGVANSSGDVVTLYNYRFKSGLNGPYSKNFPCEYDLSTSRVGAMFRCIMDLSAITPDTFNKLLTGDYPFYFQIQAVSGSEVSSWSEPYTFDWSQYPQVAE